MSNVTSQLEATIARTQTPRVLLHNLRCDHRRDGSGVRSGHVLPSLSQGSETPSGHPLLRRLPRASTHHRTLGQSQDEARTGCHSQKAAHARLTTPSLGVALWTPSRANHLTRCAARFFYAAIIPRVSSERRYRRRTHSSEQLRAPCQP